IVGIEVGEVRNVFVEDRLDIVRCHGEDGSERGRVDRTATQAPGHEQDPARSGHDPFNRAAARSFLPHFFGALTNTVPGARQTGRPSLATSIRTTAVRFVSDTICADADRVPPVTGAR